MYWYHISQGVYVVLYLYHTNPHVYLKVCLYLNNLVDIPLSEPSNLWLRIKHDIRNINSSMILTSSNVVIVLNWYNLSLLLSNKGFYHLIEEHTLGLKYSGQNFAPNLEFPVYNHQHLPNIPIFRCSPPKRCCIIDLCSMHQSY